MEEAEARQLALVSRYGICCPESHPLTEPLPIDSDDWFREKYLPLSLELRVGFLLPDMHKAMGLPHAPALKPPGMRRGYGTMLLAQAKAQAALREAYVEEFFVRTPSAKRKRG